MPRPLRKFNLNLWIINGGFNLIEFSNNTGTVSPVNPKIPHINNLSFWNIYFNVWRCTDFSVRKFNFTYSFLRIKNFVTCTICPLGSSFTILFSILFCPTFLIKLRYKIFPFIKYTHYQGRYKRYLLSGLITIAIIQNTIQKKVKISNISSRLLYKIHRERTHFYSFASSCPRFYICNNFSIYCAINVHSFIRIFFFFFTFKKHRSCFNAAREYSIEMKIKRAGRNYCGSKLINLTISYKWMENEWKERKCEN